MRFSGILFRQLFYPFGDGPSGFRNPGNHGVDPFPRLGTCFRRRRRRRRRFGGMMIDWGSLLVSLFYAFLKCNVTMV